MDEFKTNMPIIQTLGNPGMKARHWEKVSDIVGFPIVVDEELSLEKVIDFNLVDYIEKFESISEAATKENNLEKALDKMMKEWADLKFEILPYKSVLTVSFFCCLKDNTVNLIFGSPDRLPSGEVKAF